MKKRFFIISIFVLSGICGFSQSKFDDAVKMFLQKPDYKNASVGICVQYLDTGDKIFGLNSDKLLIPASTLKLVTSATALELLGADYRFETRLGYIGKTEKNNLLNGDIVIIGGADPVLGSVHFPEYYFSEHFLKVWAQQIKLAGISKVKGDLILDGSVYDSEKIPATWVWEDIGNYYGAGANAFTVYDNLFRITFSSPKKEGKPTKIISLNPKIEGLNIKNEVLSADNNSDNAYVFGSPFGKKRVVRGTIPRNRKAFTIKAAIHNPEEILAKELIKFLAKEGVFISGKIRFEKVNRRSFKTIYIQQSPTLTEIVKVLNYESINLIAEHLLKQIAVQKTGIGNREEGVKIVMDYWQSKQVLIDGVFMEDGSGLSHFNAVSPQFLVDVLNFMANKSSQKRAFIKSIPTAGEGTIGGFNTKLFPKNTLKTKSGSMTRVRCYSGYLKLDSGNVVSFSIMINHFSGSHSVLVGEIEKLLVALKSN